MKNIAEVLEGVKTVGIGGHIRPDGDCVGSCMALYLYIRTYFPDIDVTVYLDHPKPIFGHIECIDEIKTEADDRVFDLFITCDVSARDRLALAGDLFEKAKKTVCIDHHVSNLGYAKDNFVKPGCSSACEVLYGLMEEELIDEKIAEALYIGIIMDTGVFRYSSTTPKTMEIAGSLMEKGIPFWKYIDECFYQRTYTQTQLLGRTLLTSMRLMDGKVIVATVTRRMLEFYGAQTEDIEGIIDQLRVTKGVEVALLLHEIGDQEYKVSMRSNTTIDVSRIAVYFGGGGHVKAAGCTMRGSLHDVVNNITEHIEFQM